MTEWRIATFRIVRQKIYLDENREREVMFINLIMGKITFGYQSFCHNTTIQIAVLTNCRLSDWSRALSTQYEIVYRS